MARPNPRRANGSKRTALIARVKREESCCWLCGGEVDQTLTVIIGSHGKKCADPECIGCTPHPMRAEVDEIIPVSKGGDPLDRGNCRLSHRRCNRRRGNAEVVDAPVRAALDPFETHRSW